MTFLKNYCVIAAFHFAGVLVPAAVYSELSFIYMHALFFAILLSSGGAAWVVSQRKATF